MHPSELLPHQGDNIQVAMLFCAPAEDAPSDFSLIRCYGGCYDARFQVNQYDGESHIETGLLTLQMTVWNSIYITLIVIGALLLAGEHHTIRADYTMVHYEAV